MKAVGGGVAAGLDVRAVHGDGADGDAAESDLLLDEGSLRVGEEDGAGGVEVSRGSGLDLRPALVGQREDFLGRAEISGEGLGRGFALVAPFAERLFERGMRANLATLKQLLELS